MSSSVTFIRSDNYGRYTRPLAAVQFDLIAALVIGSIVALVLVSERMLITEATCLIG
jgi:hypothetical protein